MDAQLKRKWIEALRSGEYVQGHTFLLNDRGAMCCLGVLATIQGCDLEDLPYQERRTDTLPRGFNAGLDGGTREHLACMNDDGKSFPEIADYIEKHL